VSACSDGWSVVDAKDTGAADNDDDDDDDIDDDEDDDAMSCAADATAAEEQGKAAKVSAPYFEASCRHTCKYS
jgi:phosphopantothenoylcysteine synthetase/decarboxylase